VFVRGEGDLQLGADAVDARDQHRLTHRAEIRGEQATEPSDFSQHLSSMRFAHERLNSTL
jgi:hypothetical protein